MSAPAFKTRIGYVTAVVWRNDGINNPFYTVEVTRTFKDDDGKLQNSSSLNHADILPAMKCLERAEAWIAAQ